MIRCLASGCTSGAALRQWEDMSNRDGVSMILPSGRGDCLSRGNADRFLIGYLMPSAAGGPRVCGWQTVRVRRLDGIYGMLEPEPGYEADLEASDLREAVSKLNLG